MALPPDPLRVPVRFPTRPLPPPTERRIYNRDGASFTATRREMREWYARPWLWRAIHYRKAPWNR